MNAAEDFLEVVLCGYIVAAAKQILAKADITQPTLSVHVVSDIVIEEFVQILSNQSAAVDRVHLYSCEVITLGLLWYAFRDTTREGDGERIITLWKFLLIVFRASNRKNYSKEAAILLTQNKFLFSERMATQLKYSCFINVHGRVGCNIPCDLFMEHLNRRLKTVIRNMGSNIQPSSLTKAAKAIGIVNNICSVFENEVRGKESAQHHPIPSYRKDLQTVITILAEENVLQNQGRRSYSSFKFKCGILDDFDEEKLMSWLVNIVGFLSCA